jgi:hypothetical protein
LSDKFRLVVVGVVELYDEVVPRLGFSLSQTIGPSETDKWLVEILRDVTYSEVVP